MKISDKRTEIMQAALELIAAQGFHGAPMAEIAKKASVASGTIYRYFESKDTLITELHRELENNIVTFIQKGYPSRKSLRERFLYLISQLFRYYLKHPLHFRYMEQYYNSPYGISMRRDRLFGKTGNRETLIDIFNEGITQQILKDLPVLVLLSMAFGPLTFLIRDHILGFVVLDKVLIEQTTEACWDAIKL